MSVMVPSLPLCIFLGLLRESVTPREYTGKQQKKVALREANLEAISRDPVSSLEVISTLDL